MHHHCLGDLLRMSQLEPVPKSEHRKLDTRIRPLNWPRWQVTRALPALHKHPELGYCILAHRANCPIPPTSLHRARYRVHLTGSRGLGPLPSWLIWPTVLRRPTGQLRAGQQDPAHRYTRSTLRPLLPPDRRNVQSPALALLYISVTLPPTRLYPI